jgi:hypothetical protein
LPAGTELGAYLHLVPRSLDDYRGPYPQRLTLHDGTATCTLAGLLPDAYRLLLVLSDGYGSEPLWAPGVRDADDSPWIEVGANQSASASFEVNDASTWISGLVTGAWMELAIDRPSIWLFTPDSSNVQATFTDELGAWRVQLHRAGPVKVLVRQSGDFDQWIGGSSFASATVYDLQPGQSVSGVDLVQSGLQIEVDTNLGGYSMQLDFTDANTGRSLYSTNVYSDYDVGLANLRPGSYRLHAQPGYTGTWQPQWYDRVQSPEAATPVTIGPNGAITVIRLVLEPPAPSSH